MLFWCLQFSQKTNENNSKPRLGFADRHLQRITHPPLKKSRWIPRNDATGTPGYMKIDPRRRESLRWLRKLIKVLRQQDHYLNPDMRAHIKKKKREIPYVDLTDENYRANDHKGKDISHAESDTSVDENYPCTHLAFLSSATKFGNETGDEDFFDEGNQFIIPKIEPPEHPNGRPDEQLFPTLTATPQSTKITHAPT